MMSFQVKYGLIVVFLSVLFAGCSSPYTVLGNKNLEGDWKKHESIQFSFDLDQPNPSGVVLNFRHNEAYKSNNIDISVDVESPDGKVYSNQLNYVLTDSLGRWQSGDFSNIKSHYLRLASYFDFKEKGVYNLIVRHNMASDTLVGVEDIGIIVEP